MVVVIESSQLFVMFLKKTHFMLMLPTKFEEIVYIGAAKSHLEVTFGSKLHDPYG